MSEKYEWTMLTALGGTMDELGDGYAKATLPLTEKVMQPTRVYHAGAIVTLADEAASAAIHGPKGWTEEEMYAKLFPYSIQLSVNLIANDPVGPMTAEANVVRRGRITIVDTIVRTSSGETAALMRSAHMMVDLNKTGPHRKK